VNESFTSKTCGKCGKLHNALGGSAMFVCPGCNFTIPRDFNGARNILLRNWALVEPLLDRELIGTFAALWCSGAKHTHTQTPSNKHTGGSR
jgi:putative transposase